MLHLHLIQAEHGDCSLLEYTPGEKDGTVNRPYRILVDGGPAKSYAKSVKLALEEIPSQDRYLDLLVLTHIDKDHIDGAIRLLKSLKNRNAPVEKIGSLWHNSFHQNLGVDPSTSEKAFELARIAYLRGLLYDLPDESVRGVEEGEITNRLASELGISTNPGFPGGMVTSETAPAPVEPAGAEGLKLWVLGPGRASLLDLQKKWLAWLEEQVAKKVTRAGKDTSVPNLSSILLLAEAGSRRILLTGDGSGEEVLNGLDSCGLLDPSGCIHVDLLKLPHHGSARNVSPEFFQRVTADTYAISGNGLYGNPGLDTLEMVLDSAKATQRSFTLILTNETEAIKEFNRRHVPLTSGYTQKVIPFGQNFLTL